MTGFTQGSPNLPVPQTGPSSCFGCTETNMHADINQSILRPLQEIS